LAGIGWALLGSEDVGIERIFLLNVWGILGLLFLGLSAWIARQGPLRDLGRKKAEATAPESAAAQSSPAAKPAAKRATEEAGKTAT
jgi:hypothetical protein